MEGEEKKEIRMTPMTKEEALKNAIAKIEKIFQRFSFWNKHLHKRTVSSD